MTKLNKRQLEWQAQDDMRILVESEKIKKDSKRFNRATTEAEKVAKESLESIKIIKTIKTITKLPSKSNKKVSSKPPKRIKTRVSSLPVFNKL